MSVPSAAAVAAIATLASTPTLSEQEVKLLEAVTQHGPCDTNTIAVQTGASLGSVARRLAVMVKQELVSVDDSKMWSATEAGVAVADLYKRGEGPTASAETATEPTTKKIRAPKPPKGPAPVVRVGAKVKVLEETLTDLGWSPAEVDGDRHAYDLPGDGEDFVLWVSAPNDRVSEAEITRINKTLAERFALEPEQAVTKDEAGKDVLVPFTAEQMIRRNALDLDLLVSGTAVHGATTMITCVDCGHQRRIHVQDAFQVKRCLEHQQAVQRAKRNEKHKVKRAKIAAAKPPKEPKPPKAPKAPKPEPAATGDGPAPIPDPPSGKVSKKIKRKT